MIHSPDSVSVVSEPVLPSYLPAGRSQTEVEPLSGEVVEGLRGQLKIRAAYFSMLVVGKDGEVKTWFPSQIGRAHV